MLLQRKIAARERILLVKEVDSLLPVNFDDDVIAARDDVLGKPGIRRYKLIENFDEIVEASRPDRVLMRAVDLSLVALGKSGSEGGPEIHPRVSTVADFRLRLELAVAAFLCHPEQVTCFPVAHDRSVFHAPGLRMLICLPAVKSLAVEHTDPAILLCQHVRIGEYCERQ